LLALYVQFACQRSLKSAKCIAAEIIAPRKATCCLLKNMKQVPYIKKTRKLHPILLSFLQTFFFQIFHAIPHSIPKRKHLIAPIFSLCSHENHKTFRGSSNVGRVSTFFCIYRPNLILPEDAISTELVT
jgi:hypothetical protein